MAKKQTPSADNPDVAAPTAPPAEPGAAPARVQEWDPNAPRRPSVKERLLQAAAANPFYKRIPDEYFEARDWLLQQLGGPATLLRFQSVPTPADRVGLENIEAISISKKWADDRPTGRLCVKVQVRKKVSAASRIDSAAQVPPVIKASGKEILTDVESIGDIVALSGYHDLEKPARGGASIGLDLPTGVTGTFGALVVLDEPGGKLGILSNNHVLADVNGAALDTRVIQPGLADSRDNYKIGSLLRVVPLNLDNGQPCTVDAAVAWTAKSVASPEHHSFVINPEPLHPEVNMPVMKDGRTTGYTEGVITSVGAFVQVKYQRSDGAILFGYFNDQVEIRGTSVQFSDEGDSGSLIVHQSTMQPVGLLFSGVGAVTYANPIGDVIDQVGIDHFYAP
jgi:hypothetical protein